MKNPEIKEFHLEDMKWLEGLGASISTNYSVYHFLDSGNIALLIDPESAHCLFSLISDGQWMGWIGLYPVLDPFGRLRISEIQYGSALLNADRSCLLQAIHFLLVKAKNLGNWSCLINLRQDSELIPFLLHSGFKILGQKKSSITPAIDNELLILEKRLQSTLKL